MTELDAFPVHIYSEQFLDSLCCNKEVIENKEFWEEIKEPLKQRLVLNLFEVGAILIDETKPYTLRSRRPSGFYINLRELSSNGSNEKRRLLGNHIQNTIISKDLVDLLYGEITHKLGPQNVNLIIFVPHGAMNIAFGLHHRYDMLVGYAIKEDEPKDHGVPRYVHAELYDGCRILIMDDVMTTGGSIKNCVDKLNKQIELNSVKEIDASRVLLTVDRLQGGREELKNYKTPISPNGLETFYILNSAEIVNILYNYGRITEKEHDSVFEEIIV